MIRSIISIFAPRLGLGLRGVHLDVLLVLGERQRRHRLLLLLLLLLLSLFLLLSIMIIIIIDS